MNEFSFEEHDPFASPASTVMNSRQDTRTKLPPYCTTMFIVSLVFSVIRVPLVFLSAVGIAGLVAGEASTGIIVAGFLELFSGMGMAVFGIAGNIALLLRKTWGLTLAYCLVASVLLSYLGAFLSVMRMAETAEDPAMRIGMFVGALGMLTIRAAILVAYVVAILKFSEWIKSAGNIRNQF